MKILARVRRVLVGDSPFGFVHAVAEDGAEFKVELPVAYARQISRNDVLGFEVTIERVPAPLSAASGKRSSDSTACVTPPAPSPTEPTSASAGAGPGTVSHASAGPGTAVRVSGGPGAASRSTAGEIVGPSTASRSTGLRRSSGSPDPRKRNSRKDDKLRRLLGLA